MNKGSRLMMVLAATLAAMLVIGPGCATETTPIGATPTEKIEWNLQAHIQETHYDGPIIRGFCNAVEARTNGGLTITPFYSLGLGISGGDVPRALSEGSLSAALNAHAYMSSEIPVLGVLSMPGLLANNYEGLAAADVLLPYWHAEFAAHNIKSVGSVYLYPEQVLWSTKPIEKVTDFKGMTVRASGAEAVAVLTKLGASPVSMDYSEVYTALQRGIMDAFITSTAGAKGVSAWEVCDYGIPLAFSVGGASYLFSMDEWESLPAEYQLIVTEEVENAVAKTRHEGMVAALSDWQMLGQKMTVLTPSAQFVADYKATAQPYWDEWTASKGGVAAEAMGVVRAALGI